MQLWEQARLGPMTLRNRTVRSATNEHLSQRDGQFTAAWAGALEELARGEAGLIITGHAAVEPHQRTDEGQPVLDRRADRAVLAQAAQGVHRWGGKAVIQLSHSGLKASAQVNGLPPKGPEDFTPEELDRLAEQFREAALLAREAGFDGVQIHCAHGYLLSSFLNPDLNRRQDGYGGPLGNRFRLIARIIRAVRESCGPEFALLAKADCNSTEDFPALAVLFQRAGLDALEVSGLDFSARLGSRAPFYLEEAAAAQQAVSIPLILVGGIYSRAAAEQVLRAGIPFAAFSRALICQPDFIARMRAGQEESPCLLCNRCFQIYRTRPVRCVQHRTPIPQLVRVFGAGNPDYETRLEK